MLDASGTKNVRKLMNIVILLLQDQHGTGSPSSKLDWNWTSTWICGFEYLHMSLTFTLYERAEVHPRYKTFPDMILGGSTLAVI